MAHLNLSSQYLQTHTPQKHTHAMTEPIADGIDGPSALNAEFIAVLEAYSKVVAKVGEELDRMYKIARDKKTPEARALTDELITFHATIHKIFTHYPALKLHALEQAFAKLQDP